jgi:hypothetical protein
VINGSLGCFQGLICGRVSTRHRVAMCELAVQGSDWLMVDQIQVHSKQVNPVKDLLVIREKLRNKVDFLRNGNFYMVWVSGVDALSACMGMPMEYASCIVTLTVNKIAGNIYLQGGEPRGV